MLTPRTCQSRGQQTKKVNGGHNDIFKEWLTKLNVKMQKKRHVLLLPDNAPCHPANQEFPNVTMQLFPANTTSDLSLANPLIHNEMGWRTEDICHGEGSFILFSIHTLACFSIYHMGKAQIPSAFDLNRTSDMCTHYTQHHTIKLG